MHSSVDHRPTRVIVSGFETDDKAEVLAHFAVSAAKFVCVCVCVCAHVDVEWLCVYSYCYEDYTVMILKIQCKSEISQ